VQYTSHITSFVTTCLQAIMPPKPPSKYTTDEKGLRIVFDTVDRNHDGNISKGDFIKAARG
jgi:Ca2+-binding EF-hand superfamily protein